MKSLSVFRFIILEIILLFAATLMAAVLRVRFLGGDPKFDFWGNVSIQFTLAAFCISLTIGSLAILMSRWNVFPVSIRTAVLFAGTFWVYFETTKTLVERFAIVGVNLWILVLLYVFVPVGGGFFLFRRSALR